jgi:transposase-like protein
MAAAISPGAGRAYGVARVCDGFGVARSSFYAWRRHQERTALPPLSRRGPKPAISDATKYSGSTTLPPLRRGPSWWRVGAMC